MAVDTRWEKSVRKVKLTCVECHKVIKSGEKHYEREKIGLFGSKPPKPVCLECAVTEGL